MDTADKPVHRKLTNILRAILLLLAASLPLSASANTPSASPQPTVRISATMSVDTGPEDATLASAGDEKSQVVISEPFVTADPDAEPRRASGDLWQRVRMGMAIPELDSPLVEANERRYSGQPSHLKTTFSRARPYLYHIVKEVEARGMPTEIALLPLIESAYNPKAMSPANASGIWQFIPSTGKVYGLKQNSWYDGRRDVVSATSAALDYLSRLRRQFGDWPLALAAYNCGEGCVARAINKNRIQGLPTDYLSLELPTETRNYVPRLIAVSNIVKNPSRFGLRMEPIPNEPYFRQVRLPYPIEARTAARLAEIDVDELLVLNPGFRRHVIHAEYQNVLFLPINKLENFEANLEAEESHKIRLRSYNAQKGELLTKIAEKYDVTVQWLQDHNPLTVKRGKIVQAQTLIMPPTGARTTFASASQPVQVAAFEKPEAEEKPAVKQAARKQLAKKPAKPIVRTHTVRKGDTLIALAKRYNVTVADIREINGRLKILKPGAKLQIPLAS
jgi:membrane-bound lytic murein transglycosylase D